MSCSSVLISLVPRSVHGFQVSGGTQMNIILQISLTGDVTSEIAETSGKEAVRLCIFWSILKKFSSAYIIYQQHLIMSQLSLRWTPFGPAQRIQCKRGLS